MLICACLVGSAAAAGQTPTERVKEGADKIIKILSEPAIGDTAQHDAAIKELRTVAEQYIDFRLTTMYAVGKPWLKMSKDLQDRITEAFIQLMERTYLKRIPAYNGQGVQYLKEEIDGKKAKVVSEINDKDKKLVVEFRLRMVQEVWMIYDVVAEGVSLVANYRSQFSQVLADGTGEELLDLIQKRIKQLDEQGDGGDDNATCSKG
ncbi:ABC transporter substrate-binding protein [Pseudodesulfovibrio sp.]|uniref:Tgt2/MlaC family protein n=1 Tax=Pseudodesulfovibrio sp. TaxID=2035812 RepID=UPI002608C618|nr:ABC transporter substrate-binding protein [Pseudodesulfovibrio sp.]MDD3311108.1 ABC transporter substrate-binding protein [Pseudodesulfovibrio sp.]